MMDVYLPLMKCAAILTAAKLDLFNQLNDAPISPKDLAKKMNMPVTGIGRLLEALVVAGYVQKQQDLYSNTTLACDWFSKKALVDYTPGILWTANTAWHMVEELGQVIQNGMPSPTLWERMAQNPSMG